MSPKLGIIGAGGIGTLHAEAASKAGWSIAGFCDIQLERARGLAGRHAGALATTSVEELLGAPEIGAVVVAVPNHLHRDMAIAAMRAGKDVLLEKPMAMNVGQCDEILEVRRATGRILQMNFVCRRTRMAQAARDFIAAGRLGRIYHAKASMYRRRGIPGLGRWFTTKSQAGGGVLIDLGVHVIDLVRHLTGSPRAVRVCGACTSAFGSPIERYRFVSMWAGPVHPRGVFDVEDGACALIRFEGGLTLEVNVTWAMNLPEGTLRDGVVLLGDRGGCSFDIWKNRFVLSTEEEGQLVDLTPQFPDADPWLGAWITQHEIFRSNVEHRRQPDASGEDGRDVQAILDAIYRSSAEGREVEIG
jgi:predicted dehydrogenase